MNTIRNYLEGMFASLPKTREVLKAKSELLQMMEDKYNELIDEGKTDNEAIGIVISEFGNLDELSESLGLNEVKEMYSGEAAHLVDEFEVKDYLAANRRKSFFLALGIFICINSISICAAAEALLKSDALSMLALFLTAVIGAIIIVFAAMSMRRFKSLFDGDSRLDFTSDKYVKEELGKIEPTYAIKLTAGILFCVLCWLPIAIVDEFSALGALWEDVMEPVIFFSVIGLGVFLIVQAGIEKTGYENMVYLGTKNGERKRKSKGDDVPDYENATVDLVMHVYWPTISAIYLTWSFITFRWGTTWIIWPIAAGVFGVLKALFRKEEKQ